MSPTVASVYAMISGWNVNVWSTWSIMDIWSLFLSLGFVGEVIHRFIQGRGK